MDATLSDPLVGRLIDARYRVLSRIGRGGMGVVYRAEDERLEREVALKVLRADLAHDHDARQRFVREAKAAARLTNPHAVSVLDQGTDGETAYLVMELVPGRTLRDAIAEQGSLRTGDALEVLEGVLDALAEAHRKGIVHRDVKPANVLVGDRGTIKVADFGLARSAASAATTGATELLGTAEYLAPERVARGIADARSDVYAAGVLLFEMLTGRPPFTGDAPATLAYRHVHDHVPPPSSLAPGLPLELDGLVARATAKDPDDRPVDAGRFLDEVRAVRARLAPAELARRHGPSAAAAAGGATTRIPLDADGSPAPAAAPGSAPASGAAPARPVEPVEIGYGPGGRRRRSGLIAMVAVVLALALAGGTVWFFGAGPGAYTDTPRGLVGRTEADARGVLTAAGLEARVERAFHDTVPPDAVISTRPAEGGRVRKEGAVTLVVSRGPELFGVPLVVGQDRAAAETMLTDAQLAVGDVREEWSEDVPRGQVISSDPQQGEQLRRGEPVALVVSRGRQPIEVPAVVGEAYDDAVDALQERGLTARRAADEFSESVPAGAVVRQSPGDGTLFRGDPVTLVVSKGPPLVQVPSVQGLQLDAARAQLEALGLRVEVQRAFGGIFGTVRSSTPEAGTSVPKGSTVTLLVV